MGPVARPMQLTFIILIAALLLAVPSFSQSALDIQSLTGPANVTISNLSIQKVVGLNSRLAFGIAIRNNGGLAASNVVLNLNVTGPVSFQSSYSLGGLSPLQNESIEISEHNATYVGNYTVVAEVGYLSNGTIRYAKPATGNYAVELLQFPINPNALVVAQTPYLSITYLPLYTGLFTGQRMLSQIGIENTNNQSETISVGVRRMYSNYITLPRSRISLQPNGTSNIQFILNATKAEPSTYQIPIDFRVTLQNGTIANVMVNVSLTVVNRTSNEPTLLNQVLITNYTNSTTGIIEIQSPDYQSISNAVLITTLPLNVTDNISSISTYGLPSRVVETSDSYKLYWSVPYIPAGQTVYAYYQIGNLSYQQFPFHTQSALIVPSQLKSINILQIRNLSLPVLYTGTPGNLSVEVAYTGTVPQQVSIHVAAPPGITVYNSTKAVNASPNQIIRSDFGVLANGSTGTAFMTLYLSTQGANMSYPFELTVLQGQNAPGRAIISATNEREIGIAAASSIVIVLLIYGSIVIINRSRYDNARFKRLVEIKEQIKRAK